jgi:hypothetical protein
MGIDKFYIGPYDKDSGLQTSYRPYAIPDTAFAELTNAYVFRGRVRKRFGSRWMGNDQLSSRLRLDTGINDVGTPGTYSGFVPRIKPANTVPTVTPAKGQMFSIGTEVFTVNALGTPAPMLRSGVSTLATFNTTTGGVTIQGAIAGQKLYYYPALPVMGLQTYENPGLNNEPTIAFDTRFAYQYLGTGWERIATENANNDASWLGDDNDFFWTSTWYGADASSKIFFVTNNNAAETNFLRYYDGSKWYKFNPEVDSVTGATLEAAKIIVPFRNHLIALNTTEAGVSYQNRARYAQIGDPLAVDAWDQQTPGKGSYIDASTSEAIVTVEFVKDRLIVYFERSTWELAYTGNQVYPYSWQQINTELGVESTFSVIPFDKVAIGVGNVGIHACNGANVERIDDKIPNTVFEIHNDGGIYRVYGIRDYFVEMLYWSFPDNTRSVDLPYCNRVLVFNYQTGTWSMNVDSITCFGYYWPSAGVTWDSQTITWDMTTPWDSGSLDAEIQQVIAGNQEGYVFLIDTNATTNAPVLQITDITVANNYVTITSMNHNMQVDDYVYFQDIAATGNLTLLNGSIDPVTGVVIHSPIFRILSSTPHTFMVNYVDINSNLLAGTYKGNGTISRVSNLNIRTKEYNFYAGQGRNAYVSRVDCLVDKTDDGQIDVDYFISTSASSTLGTGNYLGTGTLETSAYTTIPFEASMNRLWHPVYLWADGECVQLQFKLNDTQMRDALVREANFQLHAMIFSAMPSSMRLG